MTASDFKDAYQLGQGAEIKTHTTNEVEHILIPPNCDLKSMEYLMDAPQRIKAHPEFYDIPGFNDYIKDFKEEGSRIFVDDSNYRFVTVFDCHSKDAPAWGDHSASLNVEISDEWKRFKNLNGKKLEPIEFAEFLEDNVGCIKAGNLSGADLLTMAQNFKIKIKGDLQIDDQLHNGLRHLTINDDSTLKGANEKGKEVKFPETLTISLRFFKNCSTYPVEVFLRYRANNDSLFFFIKIPDPDGLQEEAFNQVMAEVKEATELPTLKGSFQGPSHKG